MLLLVRLNCLGVPRAGDYWTQFLSRFPNDGDHSFRNRLQVTCHQEIGVCAAAATVLRFALRSRPEHHPASATAAAAVAEGRRRGLVRRCSATAATGTITTPATSSRTTVATAAAAGATTAASPAAAAATASPSPFWFWCCSITGQTATLRFVQRIIRLVLQPNLLINISNCDFLMACSACTASSAIFATAGPRPRGSIGQDKPDHTQGLFVRLDPCAELKELIERFEERAFST
jgi:hypothetical protein